MLDMDAMLAEAAGVGPVLVPTPPAVPEVRRQEVAAASEARRSELLGNAGVFRRAAITGATGSGANTAQGLEADLLLPMEELRAKYGFEEGTRLSEEMQRARNQYRADTTVSRSGREALYDTASSVVSGLGNSILGLGALGLGAINDRAGVAAAQGLEALNRAVEGTQSPGLQSRRAANQERGALDSRDNAALFEKESQEKGGFRAGVNRIIREGYDAVGNVLSDPALLGEGVAQGVGSILAAGPITKALRVIGEKVLQRTLSKTTATSVGIGTMESANVYTESVNNLREMKHEERLVKSPEYAERISKGEDPQKAWEAVINKTALMAAGMTAPGAIAAGRLVARFEGAPLSVGSLRQVPGNLVREGVEEATQGALGTTAQNVATAQIADQTRTLSEGVGQAAGLGGLFGLGAAGALQAPGAAARGVRSGVGAIGSAVEGRVERLREANEAASPVSDTNIQAAATAAVATAPAARETLVQAVEASEATPEVKTQTNQAIDRLLQAGEFPTEWLTDEQIPAPIRERLTGSVTIVDAMKKLAVSLLDEKNLSDTDRMVAAQMLMGIKSQFEEAANSDVALLLDRDEGDPARVLAEEYTNLWARIDKSPGIARALTQAGSLFESMIDGGKLPEINAEVLATPEGQQKAELVTTAAILAPEKAQLQAVTLMLQHATQGKLRMTVPQFQALKAVEAILKASERALEAQKALGHKKLLDEVSAQIVTERSADVRYKSATAHATAVFRAMQAKNQTEAKAQLTNLGLLAQGFINKVEAVNRGFKGGDRKFTTKSLKNDGTTFDSYAPIIHKNANSIELAQRIELETKRLVDVYNGMVEAFPALEGETLEASSLVPELKGKPQEVAQRLTKPPAPPAAPTVVANPRETKPVVSNETPVGDTQTTTPTLEPKAEEATATPREDVPAARQAQPEQGAVAQEEAKAAEPKEENQTTEPETAPSLAATYPNLVEGSRFTEAHKLPETPRTRLVRKASPLEDLQEALQTSETLNLFTDGAVGPNTDVDVLKAVRDFLGQGDELIQRLNARLQAFVTKNQKSLEDGKNAFGWVNGKPLNIVEKTDKGYAYNQSLQESAVIAGLQWFLNLTDTVQTLDEESIAELLNLEQDSVPSDLLDQMRDGYTTESLKRSLAAKVQEYWGLTENRDAPRGYTVGVAEAMASELLEVLVAETEGDLRFIGSKVTIPAEFANNGNKPRDINIYRVPTDLNQFEVLQKAKPIIDKAVLVDPTPTYYFGEQRPKLPDTQHRNQAVKLSDEQKAAITNANNTRYSFDSTMLSLMENIGPKMWLEIFGAGSLEGKKLNKEHAKSLEGENRSITSAWNALMSLKAQTELEAETQGVELDQVGIHYAHNINRTGRLQNLAAFNPQSSKDIREAVVSTWSTLDLSNQNNPDYERFIVSMAQALGISIHKQPWETSVAKVEGWLQKELAPALSQLESFLETGRLPEGFAQSFKTSMAAAGIKAPTRASLRSLLEYARYQSLDVTERKTFRTSLYVEADGITNGPINAMRLLAIGQVTPEWIEKMAKGGMSLDPEIDTTNKYYVQPGAKDLYSTATDALKELLSTFIARDITSPKVQAQNAHLRNIMRDFLPNARIEGDQLTFDRGVAKNPLTITIYGSGIKGLTSKVTGAILESIYERMSLAAQRMAADSSLTPAEAMFGTAESIGTDPEAKFQRFQSAVEALTTSATFWNKEGKLFVGKGEPQTNGRWDFESFKIDGNAKKNLESNLRTLFVDHLFTAVKQTVGEPTMKAAELIKNATQIQSIFQQHAFQSAVEKLIEEKKANSEYAASEGLSKNELEKILRQVLKTYPPIQGDNQSFLPAGSQNADIDNAEFSRSFTDGFKTKAQVNGLKNAGVAGIPYMIIGSGDGYMIQRLASAEDAPTNALYIYDGVHFDLSTFEANSVKANKAVYDSWQGNPLQAVADTFGKSMPSFDMSMLSRTALDDVGRVFGFKPGEATVEGMTLGVQQTQELLLGAAQDITALNRAVARVSHSIDQMSSARSPYKHQGIVLTGSSAEKAAQLEALRQEELAKLRKEPVAPKKAEPTKPTTPIGQTHSTGVQILKPASLDELVNKLNLPPVAKAIYDQIRLGKVFTGYTIIVGNPDQIRTYTNENGLTAPALTQSGQQINGVTSIGDKTIYIAGNVTPEVVVHEAVHAASVETVLAVFEGNQTEPTLVKAVENISNLMNQFLALNVEGQGAYSNAKAAIEAWQRDTTQPEAARQAAALNEFMAWSLANQDLNKLLADTKSNDLVSLVKNVLSAIKSFLFGSGKTKPADDMLSQLIFNSSIIIRTQPSLAQEARSLSLHMSTAYGNNPRLAELNTFFNERVTDFLTTDSTNYTGAALLASKRLKEIQYEKGQQQADDLMERAIIAGFASTPQAQDTFKSIVAALATEAAIDPNALAGAQRLYAHVLSKLEFANFMVGTDLNDQNDVAQATAKFDFIVGKDLVETDLNNRSSLLPVFLGLALVDDTFREVLAKIPAPKTKKKDNTTIDARAQNIGTSLMDNLSDRLAGTNNTTNVQGAIDALTQQMQKIAQERRSMVEQLAASSGNLVDGINTKVIQGIDALAQKTLGLADTIEAGNPNSKLRKSLAAALRTTTALANEERADVVAQSITTAMNNVDGWRPIKDLITDLIGRTGSNQDVYDLIKLTRTDAQQDRQRYREDVPSVIAKKFSRKLSDTEWTSMFRAMAKTDLASLMVGRQRPEVVNLLNNPQARQALIGELETMLQRQDSAHWPLIQRKAKQLAVYMNTGKSGTNLLRNGFAVANLYGEARQRSRVAPDQRFVEAVDQLVTLYAMQDLSQADRDTMASLVQTETKGVDFVLAYLVGQRADEMQRASSPRAKANHYKGHTPSLQETGVSLIIADDRDGPSLRERSYQRIADYIGSPAESGGASRGYYLAPVSSKAAFNQGIFQNVRPTASGVDPATGFSIETTAGRITEPAKVTEITRRLRREGTNTTENLQPIFNELGKVVAYERSVDPTQLAKLNKDTHLARMIGVWRGRQVEEAKASFFNQRLIDALKKMYHEDTKLNPSRKSEYVNLMSTNTTDPVVLDAISLLSKETWDYAQFAFQADELWVRKDMLKDVIGERKATIGDAWTGNTRWSPKNQKLIKNLAMAFMGNEAYRKVMAVENETQALVRGARQLIIVKSMIVPAANFISNVFHLISRGVPMANIVRAMPKKLAEIHEYTRSRVLEVELEAELRAASDKPNEARKLEARIQATKDGYKRMSIWPLIEAGEFSAISDAGISRDEMLLSGGKLHAYMEKQVAKLPEAIQRAGKYAFVTKDTALFQGLQLAVQYGDFLGKAILYEDLTQRKKQPKKQALGQITEEFINYDRLSGRFRGYMEDMGLLWFYNFKIRSVKVALSVIRNNPVHALMMSLMPAPPGLGSVDTPLGDNLFAKAYEGSLSYSMGPGMGLSAPMLNPWANLAQ